VHIFNVQVDVGIAISFEPQEMCDSLELDVHDETFTSFIASVTRHFWRRLSISHSHWYYSLLSSTCVQPRPRMAPKANSIFEKRGYSTFVPLHIVDRSLSNLWEPLGLDRNCVKRWLRSMESYKVRQGFVARHSLTISRYKIVTITFSNSVISSNFWETKIFSNKNYERTPQTTDHERIRRNERAWKRFRVGRVINPDKNSILIGIW
jgi:hypothetical protein